MVSRNGLKKSEMRERSIPALVGILIILIILIIAGFSYLNGANRDGAPDGARPSYLRLSPEEKHILNSPIVELTHTLFPNVPTIQDTVCRKYQSNSCPKGCVREANTCQGLNEDNLTKNEREILRNIQEKRERHNAMRDCVIKGDCAETGPADLMKIRYLNFAGQRLERLPERPFQHLPNLEIVDLKNNNLRELTPGMFEGLDNLQGLYLGHNNLTVLPAGIFDGLTALKTLDLNGNDLSVMDRNIFSDLTNLEVLDLRGNNLKHLPTGVFNGLNIPSAQKRELNGMNANYLFDFTGRKFIPSQK